MLFEASNQKLGFSGLLTLAYSLAFTSGPQADGTIIKTEKGKAGSGIKSVTRYQTPIGFGANRLLVETSRHTVYVNGRDEWTYFSVEGRLTKQETRYADGHTVAILNIDANLPTRFSLAAGDELHLMSDAADPHPATRTTSAQLDRNGLLAAVPNAPAGLLSTLKPVVSYKADKSGSTAVTLTTTVITPGAAGRHGYWPRSSTTTRELEVNIR